MLSSIPLSQTIRILSLFMVFAAIYSHKMNVVFYLIVFVVVMALGALFRGKKNA